MVIMMNDHDHVHEDDDDGNNHDDNKWRQKAVKPQYST